MEPTNSGLPAGTMEAVDRALNKVAADLGLWGAQRVEMWKALHAKLPILFNVDSGGGSWLQHQAERLQAERPGQWKTEFRTRTGMQAASLLVYDPQSEKLVLTVFDQAHWIANATAVNEAAEAIVARARVVYDLIHFLQLEASNGQPA